MKITISKTSVQNIITEANDLNNSIKGTSLPSKELDFDKAVKSARQERMKYFDLADHGNFICLEIDDEVFHIILDAVRPMVKGLSMMYQGAMLIVSSEVKGEVKRIYAKLSRRK